MKKSIEVCLGIEKETEAAFLVSDGDMSASGDSSVWIPKSQINVVDGDIEDVGPGDEVVFSIPEWLAIQKGLV